jgi:diguanylate cyclase (GGDEF)-like protein
MAADSNLTTRISTGAKVTTPRALTRQCACLIQYSGEALGRRYLLDAPLITIGRAPTNRIGIPDDSVSREHAKCIAADETIEIEDLRSSNGTFINEKRVRSRMILRDGDIIRLGNVLLKFFAQNNIENVFHDKIYVLATIDAGTQVFNKKYLLETLDSEFKFSRSYGRPMAVIYYDLDFFKKINDAHGHSCGDYILRESAQVARSCVRNEDVLGRYGGEEFVVVLPNSDGVIAADLAENIRKAVEQHSFEFEGNRLQLTMSMGVSEIQQGFASYRDLLDDADRKLYQSKNSGRNRVTV